MGSWSSPELVNAVVAVLVAVSVALQTWSHARQVSMKKQVDNIEANTNGTLATLSGRVEASHAAALADKDKQIANLSVELAGKAAETK